MERPDQLVWGERLRKEKGAHVVEGKLVRISETEGEEEIAVEEAGSQVEVVKKYCVFLSRLVFWGGRRGG